MRHLPQNRGATQRTENLRKEDGISKQQIKEINWKQKITEKKRNTYHRIKELLKKLRT
jgi:hypothetical protein